MSIKCEGCKESVKRYMITLLCPKCLKDKLDKKLIGEFTKKLDYFLKTDDAELEYLVELRDYYAKQL